ncbi:MBL fold metallo-hydrolase [Nocardioides mesophilus]|uniref:MBL fold metallo-hydrolase n=1 Tax=Nocardioides mesophilus TaxID=433659 RepID=A0A7G9RFT0_9ACTN|nr:MBL fold metallo-hydrolase [Nocardioides mesophilus]QNN54455.1 MBL fold metallo-hydrolase [Nocardioides mesophilus]
MSAAITRIHHLNCATMRPAAARLGVMPERLVAHCLLIESDAGLTLVDTGIGARDVADPKRLGPGFARLVGAALDPAETALAQVQALGLDPRDVRDLVLTHLDLDHAGGIPDFPEARVHVSAEELAAAQARRSPREKGRYLPVQWDAATWATHEAGAAVDWFGFGALPVVGDDVLLVPLPGHTRGHSAVAVRRPSGGWLLHCGDAYFFHGEVETPRQCPVGLRAFQSLVQMDRGQRHANQDRLRELHADPRGGDVTMFSAHDAVEFDRLRGRTD